MEVVTNPNKPRAAKLPGRYFKYYSYRSDFGKFVVFALAWLAFAGLALGLDVAFGSRASGFVILSGLPAVACMTLTLAWGGGAQAWWYDCWYNKYLRNQHILYLNKDTIDDLRSKMELAGLPHEDDDVIELLQANWESTKHIAGLQESLKGDIDTQTADYAQQIINTALVNMAKERKAAVRQHDNERVLRQVNTLQRKLNGYSS